MNFKVGDIISLEDYYNGDDDLYLILEISPQCEIIKFFNLTKNVQESFLGSWIKKYFKVIA
jgi:hypothetical protein